ncbi:hypothetical protein [Fusobacterium polymorphum]|uniref:hypothetical protein n=1 Tax=Fusobacterium nucleatum subsp. polymorphum TaxID=76857 RepID=UPI0030CA8E46
MVNYVVFNSQSLPFKDEHSFQESLSEFIKIFKKLSLGRYYTKIMIKGTPFNIEFYKGVNILQIKNKDLKTKILSLIINHFIEMDYSNDFKSLEYQYRGNENEEMGYVHKYDTFLISFLLSDEWKNPKIELQKIFLEEANLVVNNVFIDNLSQENHFLIHKNKLKSKESEIIELLIDNFPKNKTIFFNKIIVNKAVEEKINVLPHDVWKKAVEIMYNIEFGYQNITDYDWSDESDTVKQNPKLKKERLFKFDNGESLHIFTHIKNFPQGYRMYYLEKDNKIYICYLGCHLSI